MNGNETRNNPETIESNTECITCAIMMVVLLGFWFLTYPSDINFILE